MLFDPSRGYDIIGDVHGCARALEQLLERLGYRRQGGVWRHPRRMAPFLGANMALIGSNTYGKPVGQIALDRPECDDRLRAVALKIENADHQGEYYGGLATTVPNTCRAGDDIGHQLGDPNEAMVSVALDFLAGRGCTAITAIGTRAAAERGVLVPASSDSTVRRELPGAY